MTSFWSKHRGFKRRARRSYEYSHTRKRTHTHSLTHKNTQSHTFSLSLMHAHQNIPSQFSLSLSCLHIVTSEGGADGGDRACAVSRRVYTAIPGVCSKAPKDVDASLLGHTIIYQLTNPSGWFPAKSKKLDKQK